MADAATARRLSVDLERLLPKVLEAKDEHRRVAFAQAALAKIEAFESAAGDDAQLMAKVATYEEAMLRIIAALRPADDAPGDAPAAAAAEPADAPEDGDDDSLPSDDLSDDGAPAPAAAPKPADTAKVDADEATRLQRELELMTTQMKASSLAVNDKLKQQNAAMGKLDDATAANEEAVKASRAALDERSKQQSWQTFQAIGALAAVAVSFVATYVFMSIFPKHRARP
jgi:hypothetical protein